MLSVEEIEREIEKYFLPYPKDGSLYLSVEGRINYLVDKKIVRRHESGDFMILVEERGVDKDKRLYSPYIQVMANIDQALKNIERKKKGKMGTRELNTENTLTTEIPKVAVDDIDPNEIDF